MSTRENLLTVMKKFIENDYLTAARIMEEVKESQAVDVLNNLPPKLSVKVISSLQPNSLASLLTKLPASLFDEIISNLDPQKISDIILGIPDELRKSFLDKTPEKSKRHIQELLTFPEDSAGRLMTKDYVAFHSHMKVKDAISKIRTTRKRVSDYTYIVDDEHRLAGVLSMYNLIQAHRESNLESIMERDIYKVDCFDARQKIVDELKQYRYSNAPVVDSQNHMLGIIRAERLIGQGQENVAGDIQKMVGVSAEERTFSSVWFSLRKRLPWLHVNLVTAFAAAGVVAIFEDIIHQITALAIFLPVVAGQGGNSGAQTLAVVMRGLVMREIPKGRFKKLILKEGIVGCINGVVIGIVTGLIAWLWRGNPFLGIVIGMGMIVNLIAAGLSGAAIPIVMKKLGADPAQSSSIILTTVTDVVGFFSFLSFAVLFQKLLL
ncbi:MAG: magnesium transporter [Candidatus Scalindua sp. AMX11]|nr:MAG: magnesium transporter [Candidatus Scalindua sp.]NOG85111.1 magnesium transporter [Planctomycetota bacterium]RZV69306.1 MAG: magnesium transporter [Candidatus Scalindua sp. SCAELEC01]TDE66782.1 MAG: magnesium transporter [Candidatus Scalindua sp. AMX11]GJQ60397.1 MAG: magnesium transporter MgtE [Candidatus Scalindua sp.]